MIKKIIKVIKVIREPAIALVGIMLLMTVQSIYQTQTFLLLVLGIVIISVIVAHGYLSSKRNRLDVDLNTKVKAFVMGAVILIIAVLINSKLTGLPIVTHLYKTLPLNILVYNCLLAPMGEEAVYRQMLYGNCPKVVGTWVGRIVTGFIFVLMHYPSTPTAWLYYSIAAVGIYVAYEKSGNDVRVSTALHLLTNLTVII